MQQVPLTPYRVGRGKKVWWTLAHIYIYTQIYRERDRDTRSLYVFPVCWSKHGKGHVASSNLPGESTRCRTMILELQLAVPAIGREPITSDVYPSQEVVWPRLAALFVVYLHGLSFKHPSVSQTRAPWTFELVWIGNDVVYIDEY